MGELTINLNGDQADIVRRAVAGDAEDTAKAIAAHVGSLVDGHFHRENADYNRQCLEFCVNQLQAEIAVLEQLPWSTEEEADLELIPKLRSANSEGS
jgi:hypothetical protein